MKTNYGFPFIYQVPESFYRRPRFFVLAKTPTGINTTYDEWLHHPPFWLAAKERRTLMMTPTSISLKRGKKIRRALKARRASLFVSLFVLLREQQLPMGDQNTLPQIFQSLFPNTLKSCDGKRKKNFFFRLSHFRLFLSPSAFFFARVFLSPSLTIAISFSFFLYLSRSVGAFYEPSRSEEAVVLSRAKAALLSSPIFILFVLKRLWTYFPRG